MNRIIALSALLIISGNVFSASPDEQKRHEYWARIMAERGRPRNYNIINCIDRRTGQWVQVTSKSKVEYVRDEKTNLFVAYLKRS